jgi:hypothetical protein
MVRDVRTNEAGSGESHWGERESFIRQRTDGVKQKLDNSISPAASTWLRNMEGRIFRHGSIIPVDRLRK